MLESPECFTEKEENFYVFENIEESYVKNGVTKTYTGTVRVDKKQKLCDVVKKILIESKNHLCHRSHVVKVWNILPLIKDSFDDKYIQLDFSENIAMKLKSEGKDVHFTGKEYILLVQLLNQVSTNRSSLDWWYSAWRLWMKCYKISSGDGTLETVKSGNAPTGIKTRMPFLYAKLSRSI